MGLPALGRGQIGGPQPDDHHSRLAVLPQQHLSGDRFGQTRRLPGQPSGRLAHRQGHHAFGIRTRPHGQADDTASTPGVRDGCRSTEDPRPPGHRHDLLGRATERQQHHGLGDAEPIPPPMAGGPLRPCRSPGVSSPGISSTACAHGSSCPVDHDTVSASSPANRSNAAARASRRTSSDGSGPWSASG